MKKKFYNIAAGLLLSFFLFQGCSEEPLPSIYDSVPVSKEAPTIASMTPAEAIAVVTPITITGTNFSPVVGENFVYFDGKPGKVLEATTTQLKVLSANVISDTAIVKVRVSGSEYFSNTLKYKLTPAIKEIIQKNGDPFFTTTFKPFGISVDNSNNLYVSVSGLGVKKITENLSLTDFAPKGAETFWQSLKYGPASTIYGAKNLRGVWRINEGAAPPNSPWVATPTGTSISDLDFGPNQNVWGVGNTTSIFMLPQTGTLKSFPFVAALRSVRVFDNAVYVAGNKDNIEGVWKFPLITPDSLGTAELYFELSSFDNTSGLKINAITFSADGQLLVGTNRPADPIIIVNTDKSSSALYEGAISANTEVLNFAWDTGNFLYFTRAETKDAAGKVILTQTVFKLNMQEPGAPYIGRN